MHAGQQGGLGNVDCVVRENGREKSAEAVACASPSAPSKATALVLRPQGQQVLQGLQGLQGLPLRGKRKGSAKGV